jgi:nucleoside-triphosphatase THEP1
VIHILKGPVHSGKTTLLKNTIPLLSEKNLRIDGYLSEAIWTGKKFFGYDLVDLRHHRRHPFIRKQGQENWETIGPFFFLPETLDLAKRIIHRSKKADICVVDEVGPLEISGKGVWPALKDTLRFSPPFLLLVVRNALVDRVLKKLGAADFVVSDAEQEKTPFRMVESIVRSLEYRRKSKPE